MSSTCPHWTGAPPADKPDAFCVRLRYATHPPAAFCATCPHYCGVPVPAAAAPATIMQDVPPATAATRQAICAACPNRDGDRCGIATCGCLIDRVTRLAARSCADNPPRWQAVPSVPSPPAYDPATQRCDWRADTTTWEVWAVSDYAKLRAAAYPPLVNMADAIAKEGSTDATIAAAGRAQKAAYQAACLAVKERYPKP